MGKRVDPRAKQGGLAIGATVVLSLGLQACSSQQVYGAGQQWQRTECRKLPLPEQERCLKSTAMSFDEYQRRSAAAKSGS
jgi:hypothetical protein